MHQNRFKKNRTLQKSSKLWLIYNTFVSLTLVGIGTGVIVGSSIKTITLHNDTKNEIKSKQISINRIDLKSIFTLHNNHRNTEEVTTYKNKEIKALSSKWTKLALKEKGLKASAYLLILDNERYAELESNSVLPAASSIKIPILLIALRMIDSGELMWNELLKTNKAAVGGGAGWMAYQPLGKSFPVHEIATEMIRISDNTATNLLIQRLGGIEAVNKQFISLGLSSTKLNNWLPDLEGSNTTSAKDLSRTIAIVDQGNALKQRTRDLFREVMGTSVSNRLLPGGLLMGLGGQGSDVDYNLLIKGYRVYNKTGDIGISYADAGLIQMPNNTRAVASFLVQGPFNDPRSAKLIRKMAEAMVPVLMEK